MEYLTQIEYLRNKLKSHEYRINQRYTKYDMKENDSTPSIIIPPHIKERYKAVLGWCTKAVDSIADRLVVREFDDDIFSINEIFKSNNPDVLFNSAITNALIASCSFIYISKDINGYPRLQVIEANNATGIIDPITGLLKEGYAILKRDKENKILEEAYFIPKKTIIISTKNGKEEYKEFKNVVEHPLLVPIIHIPDAVRPFGRSRITKAAEYYQRYAKTIFERAEITAEFYSFPQKYILGMESTAEQLDTWKATISSMLRIDKDSDGGIPKVGQFTTSSTTPFIEQLKMAASCFAGETGLTLNDLGFVSDNPSSLETIKALHEGLRLKCRKAQRSFNSSFKNVAYLAVCLRDNNNYERKAFVDVDIKWEPIFESDISMIGAIGDAVLKLNNAIPNYISEETIRDLTGIKKG